MSTGIMGTTNTGVAEAITKAERVVEGESLEVGNDVFVASCNELIMRVLLLIGRESLCVTAIMRGW